MSDYTSDNSRKIRRSFPEPTSKWENFLSEFRELQNPESSTGLSVSIFLESKLRQFHINGLYSHGDILNEVLLRAHKLIHAEGVTILQPVAWVKKTGFYVIREWSRKEQKSTGLTDEILDKKERSLVPSEVLTNDFIIINLALALLDPDEQRLLQLKLIECLSWRDIWEIFRDEGYSYTEAALRKKKQRALKNLRCHYHRLKLEQIKIHSPSPIKRKERS